MNKVRVCALSLLLLVVSVAVVTAGGTQEKKGADEKGEISIVWWDWQSEFDKQVFNLIAKKYMESNPNVTLERKQFPYGDYNTALKTDIAAGEGPDIFEIEPGAPTVALVNAGSLMDLTDEIVNDEAWSRWIEPALDLRGMYIDSKIYTIPMDVNHLPIVYWKEMFNSRGLQPPQTIDQLISVSNALSKDGITPLTSMIAEKWPQIDIFVALVRAADPQNNLIDKAVVGVESWENPLFKEALQTIVELKTEGVFPQNIMELTWADCLDRFNKKETGMVYPIGQFGLGSLPKEALDNDALGSIPFPKMHSGDRTLLTGGLSIAMSVNAATENPDTAVDFLKYCNSPFGQEVVFDSMRTPPGNVVDKKSDIALFNLQTKNQATMEVAYRRIDNPDLYKALGDGIDQALLGGNIDEILGRIEQVSREVNE